MGDAGFTKNQVNEITGLSARLVQYYTERGIIRTEVDEGHGRGKIRRYSKKNVVEFAILKGLSDYGMTFSIIQNVFSLMRSALPIKQGNELSLDKEGIIGKWETFKNGAYIVLFMMDGKPLAWFWNSRDMNIVIDKEYLGKSESVLLINLGRIVKKLGSL
jgi:DNA-binding transcriptional MerR regulator